MASDCKPRCLVANVHGMAGSCRRLVELEFDPSLRVAGVLANQSGTDRHREWISASLASASLPPVGGYPPRGLYASRHLGLVTADRHNLSENILDELAAVGHARANLKQILDAARKGAPSVRSRSAARNPVPPPSSAHRGGPGPGLSLLLSG